LLIKLVHMIVVQFSMSFVIRLLFVSSLFIISHPLAFVKRFFKLFSSFFCSSFRICFPACRQPVYYITAASVCQGVFQTFFKFFCGSFSVPLALLWTACIVYHIRCTLSRAFSNFFQVFLTCCLLFLCLSDGLDSIPQQSPFVNTFQHVFSHS